MDAQGLINQYKNKVINIAIIILALIVANNIYKSRATNIAQLKVRKDTEVKKNELLKDISQREKEIKSLKDTINKKDISSIINTFGDMAKNSSVKIISFKPRTEKDYPVYVKHSFDLIISAKDYQSIGKFISNLERSPDIYIVDNIRLFSQPQEVVAENKRKAELTLSTILIKD